MHTDDTDLSIVRRRVGAGFVYHDRSGRRVSDEKTLARIRSLAIPPAYRDVRICRLANGHLQAIGRDARHRKQYRYHPDWRRLREHGKFARMREFGLQLPALRRRLRRDLALAGLPRERVLAVVVSLLGQTLARIGNEEYRRQNGSFGLTTLRDRHLAFLRGGRVRLRFRGKSAQSQEIVVDDAKLTRLLHRCRELPGQRLFQYRDDDGRVQSVDSGLVNDYLREAMGASFTSKDFRTWGASVLALRALAATPLPRRHSETDFARAMAPAVREVAGVLGNTATVCRNSYVHPAVFEAWRSGSLPEVAEFAGWSGGERLLLRVLRAPPRRRAR
ncbi:MAG: DNA topoisomerase IB [Dokdonella sp.]